MARKGIQLPFFRRKARLSIASVSVDQKRCRRCGLCTRLVPEVFHFDENGNVETASGVTLENQAFVLSAVSRCPAVALEAVKIDSQGERSA